MELLHASGWRPRLDSEPFVEGDRRSFNTLADHAANVALDGGRDWERREHEGAQAFLRAGANLRLCIDGAKRGDGSSAAGLAILAYSPDHGQMLLYRAGRQLGRLSSAFVSEVIALEWGLEFLADLLQK